jgi:hypothetical protein
MFSIKSPDDEKMKWDGTKEDFILFVEIYQTAGGLKVNGRQPTVDEVGELFMYVIDIDTSPFPDFRTMRIALTPQKNVLEATREVADYLEEERGTDEMLDELDIEPSKEEQIRRVFSWMMAEDFVRRLGKYITFTDT